MRGPLEVLEDLLRIESPSGHEERAVERGAAGYTRIVEELFGR